MPSIGTVVHSSDKKAQSWFTWRKAENCSFTLPWKPITHYISINNQLTLIYFICVNKFIYFFRDGSHRLILWVILCKITDLWMRNSSSDVMLMWCVLWFQALMRKKEWTSWCMLASLLESASPFSLCVPLESMFSITNVDRKKNKQSDRWLVTKDLYILYAYRKMHNLVTWNFATMHWLHQEYLLSILWFILTNRMFHLFKSWLHDRSILMLFNKKKIIHFKFVITLDSACM